MRRNGHIPPIFASIIFLFTSAFIFLISSKSSSAPNNRSAFAYDCSNVDNHADVRALSVVDAKSPCDGTQFPLAIDMNSYRSSLVFGIGQVRIKLILRLSVTEISSSSSSFFLGLMASILSSFSDNNAIDPSEASRISKPHAGHLVSFFPTTSPQAGQYATVVFSFLLFSSPTGLPQFPQNALPSTSFAPHLVQYAIVFSQCGGRRYPLGVLRLFSAHLVICCFGSSTKKRVAPGPRRQEKQS